MDLIVKVTKILEPVSGVSRRGDNWVKYSFVGTTTGEYPKTICFSVMGQDRWTKMRIREGRTYNVSFDVESREYKGRWFTEVRAFSAYCSDGQQDGGGESSQAPVPEVPKDGGSADDVPF